MKLQSALLTCAVLTAVPSLPACKGSDQTPTATPAQRPAVTPAASPSAVRPVHLPEDEGAHSDIVEWWYFNGHLTAQSGRRYAFHYVVFRLGGGAPQTVAVAQFGLLDVGRGSFRTAERAAPGGRALTGRVDLDVQGWRMAGAQGRYALAAELEGVRLDLETTPTKGATLHGTEGLVDLGPAGTTYYYSWTRLNISGSIVDGTAAVPVTGMAWMDHQWGPYQPTQIGWDWFSLQLDDGTDVQISLVRDAGGRSVAQYGTLVGPGGDARPLGEADLRVSAHRTWTSARTGATYPMGWSIDIVPEGIRLDLEPAIEDAEVPRVALPAGYWEGEVAVKGDRRGAALEGLGYVELAGYAR